MATVLGAGSVLGTSLGGLRAGTGWFLDSALASAANGEGTPVRQEQERRPHSARTPVDPPETLDLLARIVWVLGTATPGLSLSDLRAQLSESAESLQRALAAGLRTRQLRRVGAHNKLRYVLNT